MFQNIRREQTQKMVTVRMDAPIHTALAKLRFSREAPSVNKLAIWAILDYIFRDEQAFDTLMKSYGFENHEELLNYLKEVYGYTHELGKYSVLSSLQTAVNPALETPTEGNENVTSIA